MRFVRTILAFAIAASLAVLPLGASVAVGHAMPSDDMVMVMHMADHGDMSMDDCCPDDMKGSTSHKDGNSCGMGLCCIGGALALDHVHPLALRLLPVTTGEILIPADQVLSYRTVSPPFRPPRS